MMIEDNRIEPLISNNKHYDKVANQLDSIFSKETNKEKQTEFERHFYNYNSVLEELRVAPEVGLNMLDKEDIDNRLNDFKLKDYLKTKRLTYGYWFFLKLSLSDHLLQELITAAILGLIIGIAKDGIYHGWFESLAIILSVIIIAPTTALFNYIKQAKFNKLIKEIEKKKVLVRRTNHLTEIDESELIPGDIIVLQKSDVVNVIGLIVKGHFLFTLNKQVYEASTETNTLIFPMSVVTEGKGLMIVLSTKTSKVNAEEGEEMDSKLNHEIHSISNKIGEIGIIMGVIVGIIMICKTLGYKFIFGDGLFDIEVVVFIIDAYIVYDTLAIVAIPEGLPMAGSISLAFSISQMLNDKIVINHPNKIATIAQMNYLCINKSSVSDNQPQIKEAFIFGSHYDKFNNNNSNRLYNDIMGNTTANVIDFEGHKHAKGEVIDAALVNFLYESDANNKQIIVHEERIDFTKETLVFRIPFNNAYNYMLSVFPSKINPGKYTAYLRGYHDNIIHMCSGYYVNQKDDKNINNTEFKNIIEQFNVNNYSIILFARKELSELELKEDFFSNFIISGVIAIDDPIQKDINQSLEDCARAGIKVIMLCGENIVSALETCQKINLLSAAEAKGTLSYINSKDNIDKGQFSFKNLAIAQAKELCVGMEGSQFNQVTGGFSVLELENYSSIEKNGHSASKLIGSEISSSSNSELKKISTCLEKSTFVLNNEGKFKSAVGNIKLIAQAQSKDKLLLIAGLQQMDPDKNVIGVTYDGIYDDESLRKANITFSSHYISNSLEKEQGDVILLEHSFSIVISSIIYARNIYDSIRKFIQFQLTICLVTVTFATLGNFYMIDSPLSPVQLLWINLIMDSLGALALATDKPNPNILNYAPYSGKLFNKTMFLNVLSQAIYQIIALMVFLLYGDLILNVQSDRALLHHEWTPTHGYHITFIFNLFIFMQIFNLFNSRKVHHAEFNIFSGLLHNYLFILVFVLITCVQLFFVNYGGVAVRTQILTWSQQLICVGVASGTLVINFIVKLLPIDRDEKPGYQETKDTKSKKILLRKISLYA